MIAAIRPLQFSSAAIEPTTFVRQTANAVLNATTALMIALMASNRDVNQLDRFIRAPSVIGVFYEVSIAYPLMNRRNLLWRVDSIKKLAKLLLIVK